jgi:hypothetical protein
MPLETIALVGGVLLAIVVAAMVGALVGRRFRTVTIDRRTPDPRALAAPQHTSPEAMLPIQRPDATPASLPGQPARAVPPAGPVTAANDVSEAVPGVAAGVAAASMAQAGAPVAVTRPREPAQPAFTLADPLARTAVQRGGQAGAAAALAPGEPPPGGAAAAVAAEAMTAEPGAGPISEWRGGANPAVQVKAQRRATEPKPQGRRARDWALNLALIGAIGIVGAIAFSAFIWTPPKDEIALTTEPPDGTGLPVALGDASGDGSPRTDPFGVAGLETSTPPLTGDASPGTGPGGDGATPGTGPDDGPTARPSPTPHPGGGGGPGTPDPTSTATPDPTPTADPTPTPTPTPTPDPTPTPTPTPTDPPTPTPTATPKPPVVDFEVTVNGLKATFANRTKNAATWEWSFGDGSTSTARNPSHTYDHPGSYSVRLDATSTGGGTDSLTRIVTVGG